MVIREVPEDWRKTNVPPVFRKDLEEDQGSSRPVSLLAAPGEEQLILETISRHMKNRKVTGSHYHEFKKGKQCVMVWV